MVIIVMVMVFVIFIVVEKYKIQVNETGNLAAISHGAKLVYPSYVFDSTKVPLHCYFPNLVSVPSSHPK